jgi:hypothetical protein
LAGPPVVDLIGGGCYILIIVDNFSKYYHVEILKAKSEAAKAIKFFVTKMETQHWGIWNDHDLKMEENLSARIYWAGLMSVANQHVMMVHQHVEAISTTKQEAKWKQSGSKSIEHARRNGFATEALMPLGGNLRDFCHWVANLRDYCHQ